MKKAQVVKALQVEFPEIDLFYDRSTRTWYFCGPPTLSWYTTCALVPRLDDFTLQQWIEAAQILSRETNW